MRERRLMRAVLRDMATDRIPSMHEETEARGPRAHAQNRTPRHQPGGVVGDRLKDVDAASHHRSAPRPCAPQLEMDRFCCEGVDGAGYRVNKTEPAAEKPAVRQIKPQEIDRRIENEPQDARRCAVIDALLRLEARIADFLPQLLLERKPLLVLDDATATVEHPTVHHDMLVYERLEVIARAVAPRETQHRLLVDAAGQRSLAEQRSRDSPQTPSRNTGINREQPRKLHLQRCVEPFVGIETEAPGLDPLLHRELLLRRIAGPGTFDEPDRQARLHELADDLEGPVGRTGIDHDDLRAGCEAPEASRDVLLLVLADHISRDRQLRGRGARLVVAIEIGHRAQRSRSEARHRVGATVSSATVGTDWAAPQRQSER